MRLRRRFADKIWLGLTVVALSIAIIPLASIILDVTVKGIQAIDVGFFLKLPPLPGSESSPAAPGGLGNAVQGTILLTVFSMAIGIPIGLMSGIHVSEYGSNRYGKVVRFLGDVLAGIPSIVTGVMVYLTIVLVFHSFSFVAGGLALGSMMIPIVANTSAQALKSVPNSIREASHALGIRKWRTTLLVAANAKKAIATACLLATARITGETAPLILTAGISNGWYAGLNAPVASLTYYIYYFATSPFSNWESLAWGGALVLMAFVLGINLTVRIITRGKSQHA